MSVLAFICELVFSGKVESSEVPHVLQKSSHMFSCGLIFSVLSIVRSICFVLFFLKGVFDSTCTSCVACLWSVIVFFLHDDFWIPRVRACSLCFCGCYNLATSKLRVPTTRTTRSHTQAQTDKGSIPALIHGNILNFEFFTCVGGRDSKENIYTTRRKKLSEKLDVFGDTQR